MFLNATWEASSHWLLRAVNASRRILLVGPFAKLRNATVSFVVSVSLSVQPSVRPHATVRLTLGGFSWNLIFEDFSKICQEKSSSLKLDKNKGYFTWRPIYGFLILSRSFLPRMRSVSDASCRENQNTHFVFSNFFFSKIVPFMR